MSPFFRSIRGLLAGLSLFFPPSGYAVHTAGAAPPVKNETRVGVMRLAPELDRVKPLAVSDVAGWVAFDNLIVGGFLDGDSQWLGGIDYATGQPKWWLQILEKVPPTSTSAALNASEKRELKGGVDVTAPITIFGNAALVGLRDGRFLRIDPLTGTVAWEVTLESFAARTPVMASGIVYVTTAAQVVHALDFQSGKPVWVYDGGFPDGLTIRQPAAPVVNDGRLYLGVASGEVVAVSASTGKEIWRYSPSGFESPTRFRDFVGEMIVRSGQLVFTRYDGFVGALSLADSETDRKLVWQEKVASISTSIYRNGRLFLGAVNGDVFHMDATNGRQLWRRSTGSTIQSLVASEAFAYSISTTGKIVVYRIQDGEESWHDDLGGVVSAPPVVIGPNIFIATGLRNLYGYQFR